MLVCVCVRVCVCVCVCVRVGGWVGACKKDQKPNFLFSSKDALYREAHTGQYFFTCDSY